MPSRGRCPEGESLPTRSRPEAALLGAAYWHTTDPLPLLGSCQYKGRDSSYRATGVYAHLTGVRVGARPWRSARAGAHIRGATITDLLPSALPVEGHHCGGGGEGEGDESGELHVCCWERGLGRRQVLK